MRSTQDQFTEKQLKIFSYLELGYTNKQIACELNTSISMASNYIRAMLDMTGMGSRLELVMWYLHKIKMRKS